MYSTRTTCRSCGSADLEPLFSLGEQYISDFVTRDMVDQGTKVPIELDRCRACTLVQARHSPPAEILYRRHYWYRSGVTQTMRDALADVVRSAERMVYLKTGDVVLDIGANDGTLLSNWNPSLTRVGCEPAENLQDECKKHCDFLVRDFWSADRWPHKKAKVVTACGMFYDLEDPNKFIADVAEVLADDGVFVAQLMCARQMVKQGDVGNLAHEHLEYYTLESLEQLFNRHGLSIKEVEENDVNGGSYRLYIRKGDWYLKPWTPSKMAALELEKEMGLGTSKPYLDFFALAKVNRARCVEFIANRKSRAKVWAYGASTKGNVILQWYGLYGGLPGEPGHLIEAAADRSPEKWGKYTVGTGVRIVSEQAFRAARPEYALVLPYAFLPEFLEREKQWREMGGRFIVPLPQFKVL